MPADRGHGRITQGASEPNGENGLTLSFACFEAVLSALLFIFCDRKDSAKIHFPQIGRDVSESGLPKEAAVTPRGGPRLLLGDLARGWPACGTSCARGPGPLLGAPGK